MTFLAGISLEEHGSQNVNTDKFNKFLFVVAFVGS
jgi:hypothetical protein